MFRENYNSRFILNFFGIRNISPTAKKSHTPRELPAWIYHDSRHSACHYITSFFYEVYPRPLSSQRLITRVRSLNLFSQKQLVLPHNIVTYILFLIPYTSLYIHISRLGVLPYSNVGKAHTTLEV